MVTSTVKARRSRVAQIRMQITQVKRLQMSEAVATKLNHVTKYTAGGMCEASFKKTSLRK